MGNPISLPIYICRSVKKGPSFDGPFFYFFLLGLVGTGGFGGGERVSPTVVFGWLLA
ncbi:hypothetical protein FHT03_001102 [Xanthomonas arboricola]